MWLKIYWCIYSGAIANKNNLSFQNVTLVCNQKCLSVFSLSSGSVVYLVLEYFNGCYTRQSNLLSPCRLQVMAIGATLPTTNLLRVHPAPPPPPPLSLHDALPIFRSIPVILLRWNCCAYYCVQTVQLRNGNILRKWVCLSFRFVYSSFIIRSAARFPRQSVI